MGIKLRVSSMLTSAFTQIFPAALLQTKINSGSLVHRHFFQAVFPLLLRFLGSMSLLFCMSGSATFVINSDSLAGF